MHPSLLPPDVLDAECTWRFARRSGPGGQHRNKVETAAIVTHTPTGAIAEANERRSQADNRRVAVWRLRLALALAVRASPGDTPHDCWQAHRTGQQIKIADDHDNLPALVADALDHLATVEWQVATTAAWLGVSSSQLVKLLGKAPAALVLVNRHRAERGDKPLCA